MPFGKRRTRLVSFRLSEEEYERLTQACIDDGARSISDFARGALQRTVSGETGSAAGEKLGNRTQELIDTMKELSRRVGQLVGLAESSRH